MHFEASYPDKKSWATKSLHFLVVAENVAHVLAQEALDALAELLHSVYIFLRHFPFCVGARSEWRNLLVDAVIPGNVGDKILDHRERLHRLHRDGLVQGESIHACF